MQTLIRAASLTNFTEIAQQCSLDPQALVRITPEGLKSQGKNTPFIGHELPGKVRYTLVGGLVVYEG